MDHEQVVEGDLDHVRSTLAAELPALAGRRILLTGGAGFLGHYLVQSLVHWNRSVPAGERAELVVYDNFIRGVPAWLETMAGDPQVTLVEHDIVQPLPADTGPVDFVIHAASIASPTYYRQHPIETMDANVIGLRRLLDHARDLADAGRPVQGFLNFSTSEIYGDPDPANIPTAETYRGHVSCTGPRACYDESKRYGETLCVNFAHQYGVPVSIARPFNNYGPGLSIHDRRVIPDFARDVFADRDIVLLSDGAATRTFCYIADAICGYWLVLLRGRPGEPYNIGTESPEISMATLAEMVAASARDAHGYTGSVVLGASDDPAYLVDNPNRRCPDLTKSRTELGYDPTIGLDDGLRRSLAWYAGNR